MMLSILGVKTVTASPHIYYILVLYCTVHTILISKLHRMAIIGSRHAPLSKMVNVVSNPFFFFLQGSSKTGVLDVTASEDANLFRY